MWLRNFPERAFFDGNCGIVHKRLCHPEIGLEKADAAILIALKA